jgi:RHS repeat-associated protein
VSASEQKHGCHQDVTLHAYDLNGNQTRAGSTLYAYNLENKLTQVIDKGEKIFYTYTADGLMATRSTRSKTTSYSWDTSSDLGQLALETDSRGAGRFELKDTRSYTYGAGPLGIVTQKESYTFHTDSLGSVVELSGGRGEVVASYRYTPYGDNYEPGFSDEAEDTELNPIRYSGQYLDSEADLYNMRAREYESRTGRFLQVDPVEPGAGDSYTGSYVYVEDQPTVKTDPSGERGMMMTGLTGGPPGVGGSITQSISRPRMSAYIDRWWNDTNPRFNRIYTVKLDILWHGPHEEDCTNYVSQVMWAGGWGMTSIWHYYSHFNAARGYWEYGNPTPAWVNAGAFIHFALAGRAVIGNQGSADVGDVVATSKDRHPLHNANYNANHLMVVSSVTHYGGKKHIYLSGHGNDRLNYPLAWLDTHGDTHDHMFLHVR